MKLNSFLQIKHHRQEVEIYNTQSLEKTSLIFPKGEDEVISIGKEIFLPVGEDEYKKFKVVDLYI